MLNRSIVLGLFTMLISIDSIAGRLKENEADIVEKVELVTDEWQVINDSVMGGLSVGDTDIVKDSFIFSGDISIENNGGFSSVYRPVPRLSKKLDAINLRIIGDGNLYQLRVRCQLDGYNLAYKLDFYTQKNIEQNLSFLLSDFQASFRGRIIADAPELNADCVTHVGFLITNKQPIKFSMQVTGIAFYSSEVVNE